MKTSSYIGNLRVTSNYTFIVYGSVRGLVSEHRSKSAAFRSLKNDQRRCKHVGGYSDATVYGSLGGEWQVEQSDR